MCCRCVSWCPSWVCFVPGGVALCFLPVAFQHQMFKLLCSVPAVPWARWQAAVADTGLIGRDLSGRFH